LLQRHIRWAIDAGPLSAQSVAWLYALTARLEWPLTQDIMASLRALLTHCAKVRCAPVYPVSSAASAAGAWTSGDLLHVSAAPPCLALAAHGISRAAACLQHYLPQLVTMGHVNHRAAVTTREDASLTNLNIMIAITGGYFGQDEELATVFEA